MCNQCNQKEKSMVIGKNENTEFNELNEVQKVRYRSGLSQAQFCKKFGIPLSTYCRWETTGEIPNDYILKLIDKVIMYEKLYGELNCN